MELGQERLQTHTAMLHRLEPCCQRSELRLFLPSTAFGRGSRGVAAAGRVEREEGGGRSEEGGCRRYTNAQSEREAKAFTQKNDFKHATISFIRDSRHVTA